MSVERFLTGKPETVRKLNALVDAVKSLQNLNGDVFIRTANTPAGTTIRLNFAAVLERIMKNQEHKRNIYLISLASIGSGNIQYNLVSGVLTKILINIAFQDPDSMLDAGNNRIVIPEDGYYTVHGFVRFANAVVDKDYELWVMDQVSNVPLRLWQHSATGETEPFLAGSNAMYMDSGTQLSLYARQTTGVDTVNVDGLGTGLSVMGHPVSGSKIP